METTGSLRFKSIFLAFVFSATLISSIAQNGGRTARWEEEEEEREEQVQCGGTERWSVKVLTDPAVNTINFTPISANVGYMVNIITPTPSSTMPRYPGVEDKTYKVTCNITIKKVETDNDYHLVLSDGTHTMIGEIPDPTCSAAASSTYVNDYIAARNFIDAHIASGNVTSVSIPPVVVYGVAFVDPPHGQTGAAPNNLEIHPILGIQFANTTDINDQEDILKVSVAPNPAHDNLTLSIDSKVDRLADCEFRIFDALGSLVKTIDLPRALHKIERTISIQDLAGGFYYYRVTKSEKPLYEGKFIKE